MAIIKIRRKYDDIGFEEVDNGFMVHRGLKLIDGEWVADESFHIDNIIEASQNYSSTVAGAIHKRIMKQYEENRAK